MRGWAGTGAGAITAVLFFTGMAVAQAGTAEPPAATERLLSEAEATRMSRATLLAVHLEEVAERAGRWRWGAGIGAGMGAAGLGAGLFVEDLPGRPGFITGGALMLGGGIASLLAPEELGPALAFGAYFGGLGALVIGVGLDERNAQFLLPSGIGTCATALLGLLSAAIRLPVPESMLARDYESIRDPAARATLSASDVAAVEERYRLHAPAIDVRIIFAPSLIGNAVSAAMLLERADDEPGVAAAAALLFGVGTLWPLLLMLHPTGHALYETQLESAGITLQVTPTLGGLSASGAF